MVWDSSYLVKRFFVGFLHTLVTDSRRKTSHVRYAQRLLFARHSLYKNCFWLQLVQCFDIRLAIEPSFCREVRISTHMESVIRKCRQAKLSLLLRCRVAHPNMELIQSILSFPPYSLWSISSLSFCCYSHSTTCHQSTPLARYSAMESEDWSTKRF